MVKATDRKNMNPHRDVDVVDLPCVKKNGFGGHQSSGHQPIIPKTQISGKGIDNDENIASY
jgi:hypothetical protein